MKSVLLVIAFAAAVFAQDPVTVDFDFSCVNGTADTDRVACKTTADTLAAAQALAFCHSPLNSVVDNPYTDYGCGACPADNANCTACPVADNSADNCNAYQAPIVSSSCLVSGVSTACTAGTTIVCFGPTAAYKGNDATLAAGGCGTCAAAKAANATSTWNVTTDCVECNVSDCNSNSALTMVAFLAPIVVMLWFA